MPPRSGVPEPRGKPSADLPLGPREDAGLSPRPPLEGARALPNTARPASRFRGADPRLYLRPAQDLPKSPGWGAGGGSAPHSPRFPGTLAKPLIYSRAPRTHIHLTQRLCLQRVSLGPMEYTQLLPLGGNHVDHELHVDYF